MFYVPCYILHISHRLVGKYVFQSILSDLHGNRLESPNKTKDQKILVPFFSLVYHYLSVSWSDFRHMPLFGWKIHILVNFIISYGNWMGSPDEIEDQETFVAFFYNIYNWVSCCGSDFRYKPLNGWNILSWVDFFKSIRKPVGKSRWNLD